MPAVRQTIHSPYRPKLRSQLSGSSSGVYRSPWEGTAFPNLQYTSVRNGVAGYNLSGTGLNLFWGSPDSYNTLTFYTGINGTGDSVSMSGSLLGPPQAIAHHMVQILTSDVFRSITISSTSPAFEFGNLAATPLPGALVLLGSALSGLGFMNWWRRWRAARSPIAA